MNLGSLCLEIGLGFCFACCFHLLPFSTLEDRHEVLEYCDGGDLDDKLKERGRMLRQSHGVLSVSLLEVVFDVPLCDTPQTQWKTGWKVPEEQASRWMHQICSAIRHLHERDICNSTQHCDCG